MYFVVYIKYLFFLLRTDRAEEKILILSKNVMLCKENEEEEEEKILFMSFHEKTSFHSCRHILCVQYTTVCLRIMIYIAAHIVHLLADIALAGEIKKKRKKICSEKVKIEKLCSINK